MMKCVFALILLHVCCSVQADFNLNTEIIQHLNDLKELMKSKSITFPSSIKLLVPAQSMMTQPSSCVGVFTKELRKLLNKMTAEALKTTLTKLEANLKVLKPQQENDNCTMTQTTRGNPINLYIKFVRKLNNKK